MQAIFATSEDGAFGKGNRMPWSPLPEDFAHFKATTMGHTLAVAKTTLATLPPLKGRTLELIERGDHIKSHHMIIGGTSILTLANLKQCETIWYTRIKGKFEADSYISMEVMNYLEGIMMTSASELVQETKDCRIYKLSPQKEF